MPDEDGVGTGAVDAKELAQDTVAQLIENEGRQGRGDPQPEPLYLEDQDPPDAEAEISDITMEVDEYGEPIEERKRLDEQQQAQTGEEMRAGEEVLDDALYNELLSYGIDLGVPPSEVGNDPVVRKVYERMADSVINIVTQARSSAMQAEQSKMQMEEFMTRIEQSPEDVLMLIALNSPEKFSQSIEAWERIQADPRERALVERELELRARDEAFKRESTAHQRQDAQQAANRIKAVTERAANRYGVDIAVAQEFVARDMRASRQIPDMARVEAIVKNLKPKETVMTPEKARRVKQTPTQPLRREGQTPVTPPEDNRDTGTSGLKQGQPLRFRDIVKDANARINKSIRE